MNDQVLKQFISTFTFLQQFDCIEAIDVIFIKMINADWTTESLETNKLLIITFLRINYKFRDKITNYEQFLDKSKNYLIRNNIEPISVLKGII
jgi:hypothetical protein